VKKPPLFFWLIALPASLYGTVTPTDCPITFCGFGLDRVIILFLWGKRVYGTVQSGLIAGGILLSSYQYFFQSRLAKTDMPSASSSFSLFTCFISGMVRPERSGLSFMDSLSFL